MRIGLFTYCEYRINNPRWKPGGKKKEQHSVKKGEYIIIIVRLLSRDIDSNNPFSQAAAGLWAKIRDIFSDRWVMKSRRV